MLFLSPENRGSRSQVCYGSPSAFWYTMFHSPNLTFPRIVVQPREEQLHHVLTGPRVGEKRTTTHQPAPGTETATRSPRAAPGEQAVLLSRSMLQHS